MWAAECTGCHTCFTFFQPALKTHTDTKNDNTLRRVDTDIENGQVCIHRFCIGTHTYFTWTHNKYTFTFSLMVRIQKISTHLQPLMWTQTLFWPTFDTPGWGDWRSPHSLPGSAAKGKHTYKHILLMHESHSMNELRNKHTRLLSDLK